MNFRKNKTKVLTFFLALVAITLAFPGNNFNSFSIILCCIFWMLYNSPKEKLSFLKKNHRSFLVLSILFLLAVIGLLWTGNLEEGLRKLEILLPFFVFPLLLSTIPFIKGIDKFLFKVFTFSLLVSSLVAVVRAIYYKFSFSGNFFYYDKFSEFFDKHTTYISLFVVICILYIISTIKNWTYSKLTVLKGLAVFFFLGILYILSVRISIVALISGMAIWSFFHLKGLYKWILILFILFLAGGMFISPNFQKRFEPSDSELGKVSDSEFRMSHWKAVGETIFSDTKSILIGNGTGGNRDVLYSLYKEFKLTSAYEFEYNAHNQYLEIMLDYGILGLFVFMFMLFCIGYNFICRKEFFGLTLLVVFLTYFLTESLFQRQDGVVTFAVFLSISYLNTINRK